MGRASFVCPPQMMSYSEKDYFTLSHGGSNIANYIYSLNKQEVLLKERLRY